MKRRPAVIVSAITVFLGVILGALAPAASAGSYTPSAYASRLLTLVNQARANAGLPALQLASGTTTVAASWTQQLASAQSLSHNPGLQHALETHGSRNWRSYGENVGQGAIGYPDALFHAYMQSPEHRANILDSTYRFVGVAVVFTGHKAWNTFDFVDSYGSASTHHRTTTHVTVHHSAPVVHHHTAPVAHHTVVVHHAAPAVHHAAPVKHHKHVRPAATRKHHATARRHPVAHVKALVAHSPAPVAPVQVVSHVAAMTSTATPGSPRSLAIGVAAALVLLAGAGFGTATRRRTAVLAH
ncbi:MAG: hypothetical protein JO222_12230 [Frankiales bacterium]|nr:hypothetical protein [Frankiales bacterium]